MKKQKKQIDEILEQESSYLDSFKEYNVDNIRVGDIIYLERGDKNAYEVLDVGNPFILILDLCTNFCHLYKCRTAFRRD